MAIYCLLGKSASGKDTLFQRLKEEIPDLKSIIPYTTRPIRIGEADGVEYHFVTNEALDQLEKEGKLVEKRTYHTVHGNWHYATVADGDIDPETNDYLYIATLEAYLKIREYFGVKNTIPLYIEVDDKIRLQRAIERENNQPQPDYKELCRRFVSDAEDFSEEKLIEAGIFCKYCNENLEFCLTNLKRRISAAKMMTFETLEKKYPELRERMNFEREEDFVRDCFEAYECDGFEETFKTPYDDFKSRNGQRFDVIKRCTTEDRDLCTLPMWVIRFSDGKEIDAYPEEITSNERK